MMEIGRLCVKVAGRNAGKKCIIVELVDRNFVVIDGQVKRKRCNIDHLEPLHHVLPLQPGAAHDDVVAVLKEAGVDLPVEERKFMKPKAERAKGPKSKVTTEAKARPKKSAKQKA